MLKIFKLYYFFKLCGFLNFLTSLKFFTEQINYKSNYTLYGKFLNFKNNLKLKKLFN